MNSYKRQIIFQTLKRKLSSVDIFVHIYENYTLPRGVAFMQVGQNTPKLPLTITYIFVFAELSTHDLHSYAFLNV